MIIIYSIFSGLLLGLTGGGGAIITVPALVYGAKMPVIAATTVSLIIVSSTALIGVIFKWRTIAWKKGLLFALAGIASSPAGTMLAKQLDEKVQIQSFAMLMIIIATIMFYKSLNLKKREINPVNCIHKDSSLKIIPAAIITGILTGLFGVGGGFLIVPALVILGGVESKTATATSLLIITLISLFSLLNKLQETNIDFPVTLPFLAGSISGMIIGNHLSRRLSPQLGQQFFAVVAMSIGLYMLVC